MSILRTTIVIQAPRRLTIRLHLPLALLLSKVAITVFAGLLADRHQLTGHVPFDRLLQRPALRAVALPLLVKEEYKEENEDQTEQY